MIIRHGNYGDEEAITEIFKRQGLKVDLPLPSQDPSVAFTLVGEEDHIIHVALIARLGLEAHLVLDPSFPDGARAVRAISPVSEGTALKLSHDLVRHGWPAITDAEAFVPRSLGSMPRLMELVGFKVGNDRDFIRYWKKIGER